MNEPPLEDQFYGIGLTDKDEKSTSRSNVESDFRSPENIDEKEELSDSEEFIAPNRNIPSKRAIKRGEGREKLTLEKSQINFGNENVKTDRKTSKRRNQHFDSGVVAAIERIRHLLDDPKMYDPDAQLQSVGEFFNEDNWTTNDLIAPSLKNIQKFIRNKDANSALAAVKGIREEVRNDRLEQIAEYDRDGSLLSLYRIWSLIPPVYKLSRDELAEMLARRVIYNQDDIIVINKPYGISTTRSITEGDRIAVSTALAKLRPMIAPNSEKLYVMHRLDKCTTGALILAGSRLRATELRDMFNERKIQKKYWALVRNRPDPTEGIIDIPLEEAKVGGRYKTVPIIKPGPLEQYGRVPMPESFEERMQKNTPITEYRVLKTGPKCSLVECTIKSGFTHQIRCHLGFGIGTPVIGDHKYSDFLHYLPQRLPPDMLQLLGIRSAKSRSMPMHLHAREVMAPSERMIAILAYAQPSYWISKKFLIEDHGLECLDEKKWTNVRRRVRMAYKNEKRQLSRIRLDSYVFSALINELRYAPTFQMYFLNRQWSKFGEKKTVTIVVIRVVDPVRYPLDYKWNYKVEALVNRHLELETLMWYLSTLGGAFSALGDITIECAQRAGRISLEQLKIAFMLADPITVSRCKLYLAISHIQTGRLRLAKYIIREQYRFATSSSVADNRQLKNACLGVWSKLQYAYELRRTGKSMADRTS